MRKALAITLTLVIAFALTFPDAAMTFGLCDCCKPQAVADVSSGNGAPSGHCGHAHAVSYSHDLTISSLNTHSSCESCIPGISAPADLAGIYGNTSYPLPIGIVPAKSFHFPASQRLAINSERGPPQMT